jgi:hypothetical protein
MGNGRSRNRGVAGLVVSAALVVAGCGSTAPTSPTAPSAVPAPAPQFPSLVGQWGGSVGLILLYREPDLPSSSHCDAQAIVRAQTAGTFSGSVGFNGSSIDSDKQCPSGFAFTAEMVPEGTITSLRPNAAFGSSSECLSVSDASFSNGTASSTGFTIVMTDHALCRWPPFDARNPPIRQTDRTFTVVVDRWRGPLPPQ